jgi:hypothetical protein
LIDGKDWLGPEFLGLDPPMLRTELIDKGVGLLIVGRCWCGSIGCDDVTVEVTRSECSVHWLHGSVTSLSFDAVHYDEELTRFNQDTSWETVKRAAEREINQLYRGTTIKRGFSFDWASTRISEGQVHLSYSKGTRQRLLKFSWDGVSLEDAIAKAKAFRASRLPHHN